MARRPAARSRRGRWREPEVVEVVRWERVVVGRVDRLYTRLNLALNARGWSWAALGRALGRNEARARQWARRGAVTEESLARVSAALGVGADHWACPLPRPPALHRSRAWEALGAAGVPRRVSVRAGR